MYRYMPLAILLSVLIVTAYAGHWLRKRVSAYKLFSSKTVRKRKSLLTGNELEFLSRIERAVGLSYRVMPQVSMGAIMDTLVTPDHTDYWEIRSAYASKIIDYVLADPRTSEPLLIIELDDITHDAQNDKFRDSITKASGLKTLRYWSRKKPSVAQIQRDVQNQLR